MNKKKWGNANDIFEFCILEVCITQREGAFHGKSRDIDSDLSSGHFLRFFNLYRQRFMKEGDGIA